MNGEKFIDTICEKLRAQDIRLYDTNIVAEINKLTENEIRELIMK